MVRISRAVSVIDLPVTKACWHRVIISLHIEFSLLARIFMKILASLLIREIGLQLLIFSKSFDFLGIRVIMFLLHKRGICPVIKTLLKRLESKRSRRSFRDL